MFLSELQTYLAREFTYPVDRNTVIQRIGSLEIEAPNTDDSETVTTILQPLGIATFESSDDLFETIFGNVSDEYIGRKYYDDRGGNQLEVHPGPMDERDISF